MHEFRKISLDDGSIDERYYLNGVLHRDNGPAVLIRNVLNRSSYREERHYQYGQLHRDNGPAVILKCFKQTREEYYKLGLLHRGEGPALIWHGLNRAFDEQYFYNGKRHNVFGPAIIKRSRLGFLYEAYWVNGASLCAIEWHETGHRPYIDHIPGNFLGRSIASL